MTTSNDMGLLHQSLGDSRSTLANRSSPTEQANLPCGGDSPGRDHRTPRWPGLPGNLLPASVIDDRMPHPKPAAP